MRKGMKGFLPIILILAMLLTGCSASQTSGTTTSSTPTTSTSTTTTSSSASTESSSTSTASDGLLASTVSTTSTIVVDTEFTAKDLEVGYEESTSTQITLDGSNIKITGDGASQKDGVVTISDKGTYIITGTLEDGQILVDAEDTDKVQIVLNGVSIASSDSAPIYIKNADKVFITLEEGTVNTLTDGTNYTQTDDNTVDGAIFSMSDLTINGYGTLNITGNYKHGIAAKDELVFTGGIYNITAEKDAINAKDCVKIKDGTFTLSAATGNGIQSKNGDDTTKGYVYILGGTITIVNCREGIEGTAIIIEDGVIDITAQDDGLNATSGDSTTSETSTEDAADPGFGGKGGQDMFEVDANSYISISGGTIKVNAAGDGIDSNGSVYVSGGTIHVSGPTNSGNGGFDYNGTAEITGGTVVIVGSTGMAQGFSETSTQYSFLNNFTTVIAAGTEVQLTDKDGNVVVSYTPEKEYQSVVISSPELTQGGTYTLTCGDQTADLTLSSVVTSNGQQSMGGPGGQMQGTRPSRNGMEKPGQNTTAESN